MRAYTYQPLDSAYQLCLEERAEPRLGANEVRIAVRACSLNYRDHIALHNLAGRKVAGRVPLSDGAGEVLEVGGEVRSFRPGDRVAGLFFQAWQDGRFNSAFHKHDLGGNRDGMLAEQVVLPEHGVVRLPEHLDYREGACLPCAGLTAWYALFTRGGLSAGDTVLVMGTGGVSTFALQFAAAHQCSVIVTSSSDEKLQRAVQLGATHIVNYRTQPDWEKGVLELTGGRGVDHVVEVGGPGTIEKSLQCVAAGGQIALIGVLTGFGAPQTSLFPLMAKNARIDGIYVGSRADFLAMNEYLSQHTIRPVIDRAFSLEQAEAAFTHLASGNHFGKVVIDVS